VFVFVLHNGKIQRMYDEIARYYDLTHADLTADLPFILQLAAKAEGGILECGCGSGRILLSLARAGYRCTGVDNSAAMLSRAAAHLAKEPDAVQELVTLHQADMTRFTVENGRFALAIIPYNTLLHLNNNQAVSALKRIRHHLAGNGRLFIDLINPFAIADTPDTSEFSFEGEYVDPDSGKSILQFAANQLDESNQTLHITWAYDTATDITNVKRTIVKSSYYYRFPHQLDLLLQQTGYKLKAIFGDYDQSIFDESSERLLMLAQLQER
jgi:SAM-dependent methyltransferase